jgi:hypothetical protein
MSPRDTTGVGVATESNTREAENINLAAKLALLDNHYQPGTVGYMNDYKLRVVKIEGPFVWHKHDESGGFFTGP